MANIINVATASLPRSLDVNVSVSKPQTEQTTDLSVPIFVQKGGGFDFGAGRLAFYTSYADVAADSRVTAQTLLAARDFFAQPRRPVRFAVGQAFTTAQAGYARSGALGTLEALKAVADGSFTIGINGSAQNITGINLTTASTLADVASLIQTKVRAVGSGGYTLATVALVGSTIKINSGTAGDASTVTALSAVSPATGTDISGPGLLNARTGTAVVQPGYAPGSLVSELDLIALAAVASGRFVYGWILDAAYRDTADQTAAAAWAQARTAVMPVVSNSPLALDPASTTDLAPVVLAAGEFRAWPIYLDQVPYYPDAALLAVMLSVNYAAKNSTLTAKFKDLVGIPVAGITSAQWQVLDGKGYNTFTLTGNTSRVFREGGTGSPSWFADDVVNLDNFAEELSAAEFNVFLRNGKVPYNTAGQMMLQDAITEVCERYVYNGAFSERRVLDTSVKAGYRTDPPYTIIPAPIQLMTDADRGARIAPPFTVNVNLAGAIHSIAVNVNAYS